MMSGVAQMPTFDRPEKYLDHAEANKVSTAPVAVFVWSEYGSAWFTQIAFGHPWRFSFSNGDYGSVPALLANKYGEEADDFLQKMVATGEWHMMTPGEPR